MGKKEVSKFFVILILILFIIGGILFLTIFEQMDYPVGMAAGGTPGPPGGSPPGGGGGATTSTSGSGSGGPTPIKVVFQNPKDGDTIKREVLTLLVEGYKGSNLDSLIYVSAESELFGEIELVSNFENKNSNTYGATSKNTGIYGVNITIGKNITKGEYAIIVKGKRKTYDEQRILITVDPIIYINASLDKEKYFKGERITLVGDLKYFNQEPVKNNTLKISISAPDFHLNKTIVSNMVGRFEDDYLISFAEPDGIWKINLEVEDEDGNEGSLNLLTNVSTPEGVAFYTVTFLSPLTNAEFKRGSIVPITVEIKEEGKPVKNATVDFRNPKAEITNLQEVAPGTYTAEYKLKPDEPLGEWYIAVQAVKTMYGITRAGGTKIPLTIRSSTPNLVLIKPRTTDFFIGMRTEIKAELSYADGTKVEKANVLAVIGNETIKLAESEQGVYSAFYLFTEKDVKATSLQLSASDIYGNSVVLTSKAIEIAQIGKYELKLRLFYYNILARYWYLFVMGIIFVVLITQPLWYCAYLKRNLDRTIENEKRAIEMEKDTQMKYFKLHSISRKDYDKLMLKYRERASDLKEKKLMLKKKLGGKEKLK